MDFRVTFSENSLSELRDIIAYIAENNPRAAETFRQRLTDKAAGLIRFPLRHPKDRRRQNVRKVGYGPYIIYYEVLLSSHEVTILHFWHGARQPPLL
jgi:plasmid stabilization system protein ParE